MSSERVSHLLDALIGWSIRHRAIVLLGAAALGLAGAWAATKARLDAMPDFTPPRVVVQAEAPGMGTLDVEQLVTGPLETVLLGTPDVASVRSTSSPGLCVVTMTFDDDVDQFRARQVVTERLQLARSRLPEGVGPVQVAPIAAPIGALLKLCLTSDRADQAVAARELRTFGDWVLRPRLLAIPGVAQVTIHGGDVERLEVRPDPLRLREHEVDPLELVEAVRSSQGAPGTGFVESGESRMDVQVSTRLRRDDASARIAEILVAERGGPVRVGDVATVTWGEEPRVGAALYDGRPAVYVGVVKLPWADTMRLTRDVEAALHELERELPAGARIEPPVFRQATFVSTSLMAVGRAMAVGALLVVLVLLAFLRSVRLAMISAVAIPLSLLATILVLVAAGASINGMTLGGLAISVGVVVDDAIVDVENIWRRLRENARAASPDEPLDVILRASREVRGSILIATLIIALVLVPVFALGGVAGLLFRPLAISYVLAMGASLLVALTVTPALCAVLLPRLVSPRSRPTRAASWLVDRYRLLLPAASRHPRLVLAGSVALAVAALAALPFLGGRFLPEFRERSLIAHVNAVPGASLAETIRLAGRVDEGLRAAGVASHVASRAGRAELDEDALPAHRVEMDIVLRPEDERERDLVVADVASRIGSVPGLGFVVEDFLGERIHEVLTGFSSPVVVKISGPDLLTLREAAARVEGVMSETPGLGGVRPEPQVDVPQVVITPDAAAIAIRGVRPLDVAQQVATWRQGETATQILEPDGRVIDVAVVGSPAMRTLEALRELPITTKEAPVPLASVAAVSVVPSPALINHEGARRIVTIGADVQGGRLSAVSRRLEERLASTALPPGVRVEVAGEALARREAATRLLLVGGLVLLGIFMLLSVAFASTLDAVVVLLNIPLGLVGGVAAALLSPEGLSVAGLVGFVTLFGIIARNGILLVAHLRHLEIEAPELDPVERVHRAAEERLLPIVMTAACAGLALLPLALSLESAGSELEAPMALIVCGGLVTATTLNMVVLPTIYVVLARRRIRRAERIA